MSWARFVLANLWRNPLRSALTAGAVALAVALVSLLLTMPAGMDLLLDRLASNTRISVHHKAGVVYTMPAAFTRKIRQVDGVAAAVAMSWYGGAYEEAGRVTFPNFAVEAEHVGAVYPDYRIDPVELDDFLRYRDGAIVGRGTLRKYGWKIGDRVTLKSTIYPADLEVRIVGEIPNDAAPMLWLRRDYLDEALKARGWAGLGNANVVWVRVADPNRVNAVMRDIDDLSRNSEAETASETEKSFFGNFFGSLDGLVRIILLITSLVALCIVFIAANTTSMSVRERAGEIAVLRALGFSRAAIFRTLVAEALLLAGGAGLLGVAMAWGLTGTLRALAGWNETLGPLGNFTVTPAVVAQGVALSVAVGLLAGVAPALGVVRRPVAEALREVF
ncbi:MAG TPA: FtsX-like permease family protein [Candidatus Limnocylindria bacterium]|nr:FtsX-like permease family protein [Candidatus Limnocylindria bacterium]